MNRREFSKLTALGTLAAASIPVRAFSKPIFSRGMNTAGIPLGLCDHSLRGMRLNADQILDYAIEHRLDSILLNSFRPLESREDKYLSGLKNRAEKHDISIYIGSGSISQSAERFSDRYGDARTLLKEGIRVASLLGSPVVSCRIGTVADRYTKGGIQPKIEEVIEVMQSLRNEALDAGLKFAFENHAGDLRSKELLKLIEDTGTDICGALLDPGNALPAMENPLKAMKVLNKHVICTSVRDYMVWPVEDGAIYQWTAIGEGLMDFHEYAANLAKYCPGVPMHAEIISNSPRPISYLKSDHWKGFPDLRAEEMVDFLNMVRRGHPLETLKPPEGTSQREFDISHQQSELKKSLKYLREKCSVGLK